MAALSTRGVRVAGLACAVPERVLGLAPLIERFGEADTERIVRNIGVRERRVAPEHMCVSDLMERAAVRLLDDLGWARESLDVLIVVSQTPDYLLPATSCVLHGRLGLAAHCMAFDVGLGCSGYGYGLGLLSQLLQARGPGLGRGLLLVGDTSTRLVDPRDRATAALFGDAGAATALERDPEAGAMQFVYGTDGAGGEHLVVRDGMFRHPTALGAPDLAGAALSMNGAEIFAFASKRVPPLIRETLAGIGWDLDDVDHFVFHQANEFLIRNLARGLRLPASKVVLEMERFGNTSSASIPLAICQGLGDVAREQRISCVLAGFGVGFSWSAAALNLGPCVISPLSIAP